MQLLLASTNEGKRKEFAQLLKGSDFSLLSATDLETIPEIEETGNTFEENAVSKALGWAKATNMACIADDSGLCVDHLYGKPGIYSARWATMHNESLDNYPNRDEANIELLLRQLEGADNLSAQYVCVAVLATPDGRVVKARGELEGTITFNRAGSNGFGYDPIFIPSGKTRTVAQLDDDEKNAISHRGKAFKLLFEEIKRVL